MRITAFRLHTASLYQASKIGGIIISRNVAIHIRSDHIVRETIYRVNYVVLQGLLALRKAVTTHEKKYDIFSLCLISLISSWHVTRLSRHSVRLMNERQSLHHFQFMVVGRNFLVLWLVNYWKIRMVFRHWRSNFPGMERKPKYEKKNRKLRVQWLW